ncbi:EamA family transporter [Streptomyces sp. M10(2022)]
MALNFVGVAAGLGAAVCLAFGITLTKLWGRPDGVGLLASTGWQLIAGGLLSLPFLLFIEELPTSVNGSNILGFGYLISLGAILSYAIWFRGIERLPASAVSFLALGSPIVATLLGYVFRDETLSLLQWVGIVVIISAALLAQPRRVKSQGPSPKFPPRQPRRPRKPDSRRAAQGTARDGTWATSPRSVGVGVRWREFVRRCKEGSL